MTDETQVEENTPDDIAESEPEAIEQEYNEEPPEATPEETEVDKEADKEDKAAQAINKKHFEKMQAERERDQARLELEQIRAENYKNEAVEIPAVPDPFDDDYEQKLAARDEAIKTAHERDVLERNFYTQQEDKVKQAQYQKQQELSDVMVKCHNNAKKHGISSDDLNFAANQVANGGISGEIAENLIRDDDSALLLQHLATNPIDVENIRTLQPYQAAMYIERNVRGKLVRPKVTGAKEPARSIRGNGGDMDKAKYPMSAGATFE